MAHRRPFMAHRWISKKIHHNTKMSSALRSLAQKYGSESDCGSSSEGSDHERPDLMDAGSDCESDAPDFDSDSEPDEQLAEKPKDTVRAVHTHTLLITDSPLLMRGVTNTGTGS